MPTILLIWNPAKWEWKNLPALAGQIARGDKINGTWCCGQRRKLDAGTRVFLLRQGNRGHRGIIGSGITICEPYEDRHYDEDMAKDGKRVHFVGIQWDRLIDPDFFEVLPRDLLDQPPLDQMYWSTPTNGITIPPQAAEELERLWDKHWKNLHGIW
jgi:hypothetical protein